MNDARREVGGGGQSDRRYYFAYGSNLHPVRLAARLDQPRLLGTAALAGYRVCFDKRGRDGTGKCTIEPADDQVFGAVYALHAEDERRLDVIEGLGRGYDACEVRVEGYGSVRTYVAGPDARVPNLPIFDWYLGLVLAGGRHLGFPAAYLARLSALQCVPDPDPARAGLHAALLRACAGHPPFEAISRADFSP